MNKYKFVLEAKDFIGKTEIIVREETIERATRQVEALVKMNMSKVYKITSWKEMAKYPERKCNVRGNSKRNR